MGSIFQSSNWIIPWARSIRESIQLKQNVVVLLGLEWNAHHDPVTYIGRLSQAKVYDAHELWTEVEYMVFLRRNAN